jgi:hypothetical protein
MEPFRIGEVSVALFQAAEAGALHDLGRHAEALPLARKAVATSSRFLGSNNYLTLVHKSGVASIQHALGHCTLALQLAREVRDGMAREFGEDMQATLIEIGNLGLREVTCGDRAAGLAYLEQAENSLRLRFGEDNLAAAGFRHVLTQSLAEGGPPQALPKSAGAI